MANKLFSKIMIFLFATVGIFAVVFGSVPGQFFTASYESSIGVDKEIAEWFDLANVTVYDQAGTDTMSLYYSSRASLDEWKAGLPSDQRLDVIWTVQYIGGVPTHDFHIRHIEYFIFYWRIVDLITFTDPAKQRLTPNDIINAYSEDFNGSAFEGRCSHVPTSIIYSYNQSKYSNIEESILDNELGYTMSYEVNWNATGVSALSVVGQLLTFQNPDLGISGSAGVLLNAFIAFPFWAMTTILIIKLIQSVIPFITGVDE